VEPPILPVLQQKQRCLVYPQNLACGIRSGIYSANSADLGISVPLNNCGPQVKCEHVQSVKIIISVESWRRLQVWVICSWLMSTVS
jgi:hypothetical protein